MRKLLLFIFVITFSLPSFAEDAQSSDTPDLEQAEQNYELAREKEKAGRIPTAISTMATSQGAIQALSAMSEKRIDEESESDMAAYLGTIKCNYGGGQTVRGGNTDIEIPGGNELLAYYTEYKNTATNLKNTKTALNLPSGLESQTVYDKAETNLYKNASIGRGAGGYTSLARALGDTNSADAAAWAAQKAQSAENIKTGALIAAGGLALGIGTNVALNKIYNARHEKLKQAFKEKEQEFIEHNQDVVTTTLTTAVTTTTATEQQISSAINIVQPQPQELSAILSKIHLKSDAQNGKKVLFGTNSANLTNEGKDVLTQFSIDWLVPILSNYTDAKIGINITGHTDKTGNDTINNELSAKRADSVKTYLEQQLNSYNSRITYTAEGKGSTECTQEGNQPECRRIEITLTDKTEETETTEQ